MLKLELEREKAYPMFVDSDNVFELEKQNGHWKIVKHEYESLRMFELFIDKKLLEPDYEAIKHRMDKEWGK
ncbi:hypothetical protein [Thermoanaerobacter wiegelii]|uniref:hypothetical protein n=1 Tax=Thermoanaerobacter wiegelii TaxID=46354 RepID=UPI0001E4F866|nr:hypothetical protein [Thermoanaerobacter wiegelii]